MPQLRPIPALRYALDRFGTDLSDLVCPPYDVIDAALRQALLARHPRNAVRLELSPEPDPHAAAAATLAAWRADGTLVSTAPAVYGYAHARPGAPDRLAVHGLLLALRLEAFGAGVRAHEHTMAPPKADRLGLLRATRTQLSPILLLAMDPALPRVEAPLPSDGWQARDGDGLRHRLWTMPAEHAGLDALSRATLYVADGHHRYETALAYQAEVRAQPANGGAPPGSLAADWMMVVVVNAAHEPPEIRATHRLLHGVDPGALAGLVREASPMWQALPTPPAELGSRLVAMRDAEGAVFGLVLPGADGWLLVGDPEALADRMRREPMSDTTRGLDLTVLHAAILNDRLGITDRDVAAGEVLTYTRDEREARAAVADGRAAAALLVRPTRLEQLAAVAGAGEVMPQKSTYFYPKLLTGLVFYPLEDG